MDLGHVFAELVGSKLFISAIGFFSRRYME